MAAIGGSRKRTKQEVCEEFITKLRERGDVEVDTPGLLASVQQHFAKLPTRYALDVNIDGLDVLSHKRLLEEARADPTTVSFAVRPVEIAMARHSDFDAHPSVQRAPNRLVTRSRSKPAFGSSPNLQALALEVNEKLDVHDDAGAPQTDSADVTVQDFLPSSSCRACKGSHGTVP